MMPAAFAQGVKAAAQRLRDLARTTEIRVQPTPATVKRVPFFSAIPFQWVSPDMGMQKRPWVNGAEDAYITQVSYSASVGILTFHADFGVLDAEANIYVPKFDFEWNYLVTSSGATYVSQANGAQYADRRALGHQLRGNPLTFREPVPVPAGDSMVWTLRPTAYSPNPVVPTGETYRVSILIAGYRTGTVAEADYARG